MSSDAEQFTEADLMACWEQTIREEQEWRKARAQRAESMAAWWKQLTYTQRADPYVQLAFQAAVGGYPVSPGVYRKIEEALDEQ